MGKRFFGLYRGTVVDNVDPEQKMRVRVRVPEILGAEGVWALPCMSAKNRAVPETGDAVWIAFEAGHPDYPVCLGILRRLADQD